MSGTKISDMPTIPELPESGMFAPVVTDEENYKFDFAAYVTSIGLDAEQIAADVEAADASATAAAGSATTASTAAGTATTQAGIATTQAGIATTQATLAVAAKDAALVAQAGAQSAQGLAETAAEDAENALDAVLAAAGAAPFMIQLNPATPTVPPAGVSSGEYYWVVDAAPATLISLYLNTAGTGAQVLVGGEPIELTLQAALDAALVELADAVADITALIAGLPVGGGTMLVGIGPPSGNLGTVGAFYTDTLNSVVYGPLTASGWGDGRPVSEFVDESLFTWYDFSSGTLPAFLTLTRAQGSTDAFYDDTPGRTYNTVAADEPVFWHGGLYRGGQSRNYFLNSTAPVTQTITLAAGTYASYGNGTGTIAVTANTAIGTFPSLALDLNDATYQTFTVSTGGTVDVTLTGTVNWVMISNDPSTPTKAMIGPLIVTAGSAVTRNADILTSSGALLSAMQGSAGAFIIETSYVNYGATGQSYLLQQNNNGTLIAGATDPITLWNGGGYFTVAGIGQALPRTANRVRWGFSWSAGGLAFAGGSRVPTTTASFTWPSPTNVYIGGRNSTSDTDALNGVINRIGYMTSQPSTTQLADEVSTFGLNPAPDKLPSWQIGKRAVATNTADTYLLCWGTSHFTGTNPSTNTKATSWPTVLASLLTSAGIPAVSDSNFGNGSQTPNAGVSTYDSTVTFSSGITGFGAQPGGVGLRMQSTATIDKAVTRFTDTFTIYAKRVTGTPQITVSLTGGGSATTFTMAANDNIQTFTITVPRLENNSFRIAWTSGDFYIIGWIPSDTQSRVVQIINGGMTGNLAANANAADVLAVVTAIAPSLTIYGFATNDWFAGTNITTYRTTTLSNIATAQASGDVLLLTDPSSSATTYATQALYNTAQIGCFEQVGLDTIDLFGEMQGGYAAWNGNAYYADTIHLNYTWGYPLVANLIAPVLE